MSRSILAIAALLLPLPALAQSAPAAAPTADQATAAPQQARPEQRGFSIARPGSAPATAMAHEAAPRAQMAPEGDMHEAKAGRMKMHAKRHAMRHHRRHKRHHH